MNSQPRHPLLSASLLSLTLILALSPLPAAAAPSAAPSTATAAVTAAVTAGDLDLFSGWFDALTGQLAQWLPRSWQADPGRPQSVARQARAHAASGPAGAATAIGRPVARSHHGDGGWRRINCGGQVDPNGVCH
jgi:hypothetical protein